MPEGPVLVVAGAGSGKTRVLVYRIAYLLENGIAPNRSSPSPSRTRRRARCGTGSPSSSGPTADEIWVSTFHSACVRILRREAPRIGYANSFSIYDSSDSLRLIRMILKDLNIDEKRLPPRGVAAAISNAKNKLMDAGLFSDFAENPYEKRIAEVYTEYEKRLAEQSAFDFDDLIMRTGRGLRQASRRARALPGPLPSRADRRVPGHEPRAVAARDAARREVAQHLRRR